MPDTDTITLRVQRSDGPPGKRPRFDSFELETYPKMSVLDALFEAQRQHDRTLTFRCSCRIGVCGTCAVVINDHEGLACQTRVASLPTRTITVQPLRNLPVVKDLATDMEPFFQRYAGVLPYLVPTEEVASADQPLQIRQGVGARRIADQVLGCISCAICHSACKVVGWNSAFPGPAPMNRAYTLIADERDAAGRERLARVTGKDGAWRCRTMFLCAAHCPRRLLLPQSFAQLRMAALRQQLGGSIKEREAANGAAALAASQSTDE
ncbi:MAG: succinate dehydrogenase/fumarate reductase iron-sulfur subunit [Chloroflexi bacterium]|nr:succinate dehydrogenase/fumarate reductase iron-sulfur subunit [Chloroflexota bacterium]